MFRDVVDRMNRGEKVRDTAEGLQIPFMWYSSITVRKPLYPNW